MGLKSAQPATYSLHCTSQNNRVWCVKTTVSFKPVVVKPVDNSVGLEVEVGRQHLNGVLGWVGLLQICLPQSLLLLCV